MKTVFIGLSAPKRLKLGSELIKLWQGGTDYSHVFILEERKYVQRQIVYQASHGNVHAVSLENFAAENNIVAMYAVDMELSDYKACIQYCIDNLQKDYGFLGLALIVLRKKFKVKGDGARTFHCSELVARAVPKLRSYIPEITDYDFVEPKHLELALQRMAEHG